MSVKSQIKNDWKLAIEKSIVKRGTDRGNQVRIAIDSSGNQYYVVPNSETEKTFRVKRDDGRINCTVWKKGFKTRWVDKDYKLKPLRKRF